jgi:protein pelota
MFCEATLLKQDNWQASMKIISKNLKQGEVTFQIEIAEELWYLSQLIEKGDKISGKTIRKIKVNEEADATKRPVFMAIQVEKTEYDADALRVSGTVLDGPEDVPRGSFHTFNLEPGTTATLQKEHWYGYQLDQLEEAANTKQPAILICVFDREEAYFAMLKRKGVEIILHLKGDVQRKRVATTSKGNFYENIIKQLEEYNDRYKLDTILLASPSFWKEELYKVLKNDALKKKIIQATCSSCDERAIDEVLKRAEVQQALHAEKTSKEIIAVDKLLTEISKKGKAVYGIKSTEEAASSGAAETILITTNFIHKHKQEETFARVDAILKLVDKQKGKIIIINSEHTGGKRLDGLGGIGALLRYQLSYE